VRPRGGRHRAILAASTGARSGDQRSRPASPTAAHRRRRDGSFGPRKVSVATDRTDGERSHGRRFERYAKEQAMNGYVSQLIAEGHIAELRAQAARRRLRTQAAQAAQAAPGRGLRKSTVWP